MTNDQPPWTTSRRPVTRTGIAVIALGAVAWVAGWQLGWIELSVVAAACALAVVIAVPFVIGSSRLRIERRLLDDHVMAGDSIHVELVARNTGTRSSRTTALTERIGTDERRIEVPRLAGGGTDALRYEHPMPRRGRFRVGPTVISRADPLGIVRRDVAHSDATDCWVAPRSTDVSPLPLGFAKDLEGPTSDASPAGDVAFHTIREYAMGDDRRHIHWRSTAKTGQLMVRHFVDNRRPHLAVLLDTGVEGLDAERFETAVSITASLTRSTIERQLPMSLRLGTTTVVGSRVPGGSAIATRCLAEIEQRTLSDDDLTIAATEFARTEPAASALVLVTGRRDDERLLDLVTLVRRSVRVIVVRVVGSAHAPLALPGTRMIEARDLDEFAGEWESFVR